MSSKANALSPEALKLEADCLLQAQEELNFKPNSTFKECIAVVNRAQEIKLEKLKGKK